MTPNPQDGKIWSRANLAKLPTPYNANLANYNWPCTESFVNTSDANWFHHSGNGFAQGWDDTENLYNRALAGDCPDLNTSSQAVRDYLVAAYTTFINMGVDGFRWDTMKHMDKADVLYFMDKFKAANPNLFVFGEVAQKRHELHQVTEINPHWYTWRGAVGSSANSNIAVLDFYAEATFHNVFQDGGSFSNVTAAARYDNFYSDPSTLLTWLDNHDFGPNNDWNQRYGGTAENLAACMNFMFTWRGIPVVYYGTETQFKKGAYADIHDASGITQSIDQTGRAYFGGEFANAPNHKIYQHLKKLNAIRKAVPALQNGTWTWGGGNNGNGVGYIRKSGTSEVAVGLAKDGDVTFAFTGLTNGIYRDAVTGNAITVSNGAMSFNVKATSAGIYVLNGPGMIGGNGVGYFQSGVDATVPVVSIGTPSGNYENAIQVSLSASGQSTPIKIYYTTNGTNPTSASALYASPIAISSNTTLKAIAIDAQNRQSTIGTATYTIGPVPGLTVYFKKPSTWGSTVKIYYWNFTPSNATSTTTWPGVNMNYDATTQWYFYKLPNVASSSIIFNDGTNQTGDLSRSADGWYKDGIWYTGNPDGTNTAPVLTVSPAGPLSSASALNVTISATDNSGVVPTIYYTVDGSPPTTSSPSASGSKSLQITTTTTLKAFAVDNQSLTSATQTHGYTITPENNAPVITVSPAGPQTFTTSISVNLSATDDSGTTPTLYYTIDGSTPTTSSASASGSKALSFTATTILKVIAVDNAGATASVQSHTYTLSTSTGLKIHLKTTWATPKIYFWNVTPAGATTTWPGVSMTSEGNGWYVYTIPGATCSSIIFSNNGASQTANLSRCNEGWYDNGTWYSSLPTEPAGLKIHLKTTWTNPKIYYWNTTPVGGTTTWPGATMTSEGNGWYVYTIPAASCANIIFSNNGASQTGDLYRRCNEGWYNNGTWSNAASRSATHEEEVDSQVNALLSYPNPANTTLTIRYVLPQRSHVKLTVYNVQGIATNFVDDGEKEAGVHEATVDVSTLRDGLYIYRLTTENSTTSRKLVVQH